MHPNSRLRRKQYPAMIPPHRKARMHRNTLPRIARWLLCKKYCVFLLSTAAFLLAISATAMDRVTFQRDSRTQEVNGRLLLTAKDGGLLVMGRDGVIWAIQPNEQIKHTSDAAEFKPFTKDELSKRVLANLPKGFRVYSTAHYMIFHDTSPAYAQWCGALFERLYSAFTNYWTNKGAAVTKPELPLIAVIFSNRDDYVQYAKADLGDGSKSIVGYYSMITNRMSMYDMTGLEAQGRSHPRGKNAAQINQILSQPGATSNVATIVHEATHQIAFNCGVQTRLSACPLWFAEGIAVYFETPDLRSAKGWSGIGGINSTRLEHFREYLPMRPANSLETLIRDDARFRDSKLSLSAYGEAWALTDFLLHKHPKEYLNYLTMLSKKTPLVEDKPEKRLEEFRAAFGDLESLDAEFLKYMRKL